MSRKYISILYVYDCAGPDVIGYSYLRELEAKAKILDSKQESVL